MACYLLKVCFFCNKFEEHCCLPQYKSVSYTMWVLSGPSIDFVLHDIKETCIFKHCCHAIYSYVWSFISIFARNWIKTRPLFYLVLNNNYCKYKIHVRKFHLLIANIRCFFGSIHFHKIVFLQTKCAFPMRRPLSRKFCQLRSQNVCNTLFYCRKSFHSLYCFSFWEESHILIYTILCGKVFLLSISIYAFFRE